MHSNQYASDSTVVPLSARLVLQKLDDELALLREALSKIDASSKDSGDLWAVPIYQKIIARRERLAGCLGAN